MWIMSTSSYSRLKFYSDTEIEQTRAEISYFVAKMASILVVWFICHIIYYLSYVVLVLQSYIFNLEKIK